MPNYTDILPLDDAFENAIALQDRFNTPDTQAALWWNMVSL